MVWIRYESRITNLIHLIFGASNHTKIKVQEMPRVGPPSESVAELTHWVLLMSPRKEAKLNKLMYTKTSIDGYDNICRLYVFSLTDIVRVYIKISRFH